MAMNQGKTRNGGLRVLAAGVVLLLTALTGSVLLQAGPAALWQARPVGLRDDKKKAVEEEEDAPAPKKKIRLVDEDEKPATPSAKAPTTDLAQAVREANNPIVKALYSSLLHPADQVELKKIAGVTIGGQPVTKGTLRVEPLPMYVTDLKKELKAALDLHIVDESGSRLRSDRFAPGLIVSIRYYEQVALDEVEKFLGSHLERFAMDGERYLSKFDQQVAAETALGAVLRFHQSARERGVRKGDAWQTVEDTLRKRLLKVLLAQLDLMTETKAWEAAFALTRRLTQTFRDPEDHKLIAGPLGVLLGKALKDPSYAQDSAARLREARQRLRQFEDEFPDSEAVKPIHENLRKQAGELFEEAKKLVADEKRSQALVLLRLAEETWPEYPGLRAYRIRIDSTYQILRVGMRELPKYLSPARAVTDAELRAVDLLFESLVNLVPDRDGLLYYRPGLAEGRIRIVPLGREFRLPRSAQWSDDKAITTSDLSFTIDLLKEGRGTGRTSPWGDLLRKVRVGGDPYRARLVMEQGFIDPQALMSFKVVPRRNRPHPDSEAFALKPITSGPFVFYGAGGEKGRSSVVFRANPRYGVRGGKLGLPQIREVHFIRTTDPVKDLDDGAVDLALDLTAEQVATLRKGTKYEAPLPGDRAVNRRIYFLAVNNRKQALSSADFRIALARAIDREGLLDSHFRKGLGREVHRALNGPYPARSWACNPDLVNRKDKNSLDPYDLDEARSGARAALAKLGARQVRLKVAYPAGDSTTAAAVADLCQRVNKVLPGVELEPEQQDVHDLRRNLEQEHSYDLAYWWYDFPDESYWLMPLLGPSRKADGDNFLGYNGTLVNRIQSATNLRHFTDVQRHAHGLHRQFLEGEMPFVPLWQLDPLYASKQDVVEMVPFDPCRIFARIEQWRVKRGR
jgi:ABC-type transport system substrate-binding protein